MSSSIRWWYLLAGVMLLTAAGPATAQVPYYSRPTNPYQQPALSPYLNLLRSGDPAANYYLLVRPEFQQRAINAQVNSAIQTLDQRATQPANPSPAADQLLPTLPSTGHTAVFMNYGGYYNLGTQRANPTPPSVGRGRR